MTGVAAASLGLAAAAYLFLVLLLAIGWRGKRALRWLLFASIGTLIWAVVLLVLVLTPAPVSPWVWPLDAFRNAVWLVFLASLLPRGGVFSQRHVLLAGAMAPVVLLLTGPVFGVELIGAVGAPLMMLLAMALLGLFGIEQIYRNADLNERRVLNPLCLAVGSLFVFDLFVYSHGLLLTQLDGPLWIGRGVVAALVVPALLIGAKRHPAWVRDLFVSRQMVFYSATLFGVGAYLVAMAAAGYALRLGGGEWGAMLQAVFFVAALLILAYILFSSQQRARFKVWLAKHFYRNKYDYREEWLRFIRTLSGQAGGSMPQRAIRALADILDSASGELWVSRASGRDYAVMATVGHVGTEPPRATTEDVQPTDDAPEGLPGSVPATHPVTDFLSQTNWIIDTEEYREDPERYSHAFRGLPPGTLPRRSVIVPMRHEERLLGFARLDKSPGRGRLNYEDHDLLKTVGRQMAVFLVQDLTREQLAETRQFEAFNRMTAFLMHDLKNLMAQQALIVQNAPKFKHRPEFVDDAFRTVERSVARMKKLLEQLQRGVSDPARSRVNLTPVLEEVVRDAGSRKPVPRLVIDGYCEVRGDRDKLSMIVAHAVRNAQDATAPDGDVCVHMYRERGRAIVSVSDTGAGMDADFVTRRLFRPFDTTKGSSGMGIGAYQIREYVHALGGAVEVHSSPGEGTRLVLRIPMETEDAQESDISDKNVAEPAVYESRPES